MDLRSDHESRKMLRVQSKGTNLFPTLSPAAGGVHYLLRDNGLQLQPIVSETEEEPRRQDARFRVCLFISLLVHRRRSETP